MARLIGEKCLINCRLSKKRTEVLLDTGSQVSSVSQSWLHKHHPEVNIQDIKELMSKEDQPRVRWGNNVEIPYLGYVELQSSLDGQLIDVPFLVIPEGLDHPLLGFNVIKALVLDDHCDPTLLFQLFKTSFASNKKADVECLVKLIQRDYCGDVLVRGKKFSLLVKAGQCLNLPCKADMGMLKNKTPMVFQQGDFPLPHGLEIPDTIVTVKPGVGGHLKVTIINTTKHDITIKKNIHIGMLEQVSSVTPLPIKRREYQVEKLEQTYSAEEVTETDIPGTNTDPEQAEKVLKQIDLSGLTYDQKLAAQALIREKALSFSTEDGDIGNILHTKMKIKLRDDVPVQRNYNGVPRPLYGEIKAYIEDLLNKQWIVESDSDYSSPVVAVRKKTTPSVCVVIIAC